MIHVCSVSNQFEYREMFLKKVYFLLEKKQSNSFYHDLNRAYLNFHSPKRIRMHMRKYYIIVA